MDKSDLKKIYESEPEALDIVELMDCSNDDEFKNKLMNLLRNMDTGDKNVH